MSGPQEEVPQEYPAWERVTPQSVFEGDPERISVLLPCCEDLARELLETEDLHKPNRTWEKFWGDLFSWQQRVDRQGYYVDRRADLPSDIKPEIIKRLQILEAELKVACAYVKLFKQPPPVVPRILEKDLENLQAMFWPEHNMNSRRTKQPKKVVDIDRPVIKNGLPQ